MASDKMHARNTPIGYWQHGSGVSRVIVLHGWIGDSETFRPILPAVDADKLSLAFVDYRGYGLSRALPGPYNIETIAKDVIALADHLGWDRFGLVGHSMGGKAALRVAIEVPKRVSRILGLTPVWAGPAPFDETTTSFFRSASRDVSVRDAIARDTTGARLPHAWSHNLALNSQDTSLQSAFASYFESWAFDDFSALAAALTHPIKVVGGAHDHGITEEVIRSTWLEAIDNVELEIIEGAGHYPMLETPPLCAGIIERFFGETIS